MLQHWFHGVSLSAQALFIFTKVAAQRFWTFVSLGFYSVFTTDSMNTAHQRLPASGPRILAATGRKQSKHRCEVYVRILNLSTMGICSLRCLQFCASSRKKGLKLICVTQTGQYHLHSREAFAVMFCIYSFYVSDYFFDTGMGYTTGMVWTLVWTWEIRRALALGQVRSIMQHD